MFAEADEPEVVALPPATLQGLPHGNPHRLILMQVGLPLTATLQYVQPKQVCVQQLITDGQDTTCRLKQSALLLCAPTKSQAPFLQYR